MALELLLEESMGIFVSICLRAFAQSIYILETHIKHVSSILYLVFFNNKIEQDLRLNEIRIKENRTQHNVLF